MQYFNHDTTASSDTLIINLRHAHGGAAVDAYWCILEAIYADEKPLAINENHPDFTALSVRLAVDKRSLSEWLQTMLSTELLIVSSEDENGTIYVTSERAEANIKAYQEKCEKARLAGQKGGRISKRQANAKRTLSERQANAKLIKENKGIETYSVSNTYAGGAGADETAPPAIGIEVFDEVDEMMAHREAAQRMADEAVPCPEGLNPFKAVAS